jgi:hypothetical protein
MFANDILRFKNPRFNIIGKVNVQNAEDIKLPF